MFLQMSLLEYRQRRKKNPEAGSSGSRGADGWESSGGRGSGGSTPTQSAVVKPSTKAKGSNDIALRPLPMFNLMAEKQPAARQEADSSGMYDSSLSWHSDNLCPISRRHLEILVSLSNKFNPHNVKSNSALFKFFLKVYKL
jgi:hypothetical protein